jgi:membrane protein
MSSAHRRHRPGSLGSRAVAVGRFFSRDVWSRELTTLPTFRRWAYKTARVVYLAATNFVKDRCTWRASALTYVTVLSLVPMLAFAFSVAKGLGAYQKLREGTIDPLLDSTFGPGTRERGLEDFRPDVATAEVEPETDQPNAAEATTKDTEQATGDEAPTASPETVATVQGAEVRDAIDTVLHFVQETNVGSLGAFGLIIVVWTVLSLLGSVERSFNDIWGVSRSRTLARKLSDYLSTIVLVPLFLVSATGLANMGRSAKLLEWLGLDVSRAGLSFIVVLPVVALGFAFAYVFMPNIRVRVSSALLGGIVGGSLWQVFQVAHLKLQIGVANYNAIYSTFAALPIFMFWVYASWVTVLLGAEVAAAHQNEASHRQLVRARDYDQSLKRVVALRLAVRLARGFLAGAPPRSEEELAEELGVPNRTLDEVVVALRAGGLLTLAESDDEFGRVVLTRDPRRVRVQDVYDGLDGVAGPGDLPAADPMDQYLDRALRAYDTERRASPANRTLSQLAEIEGEGSSAGERAAGLDSTSARVVSVQS